MNSKELWNISLSWAAVLVVVATAFLLASGGVWLLALAVKAVS